MIGRRKYWVKERVTKRQLANFVNKKLKEIGYKTKKIKVKGRQGKPNYAKAAPALPKVNFIEDKKAKAATLKARAEQAAEEKLVQEAKPVSYTHLTLPTKA